MLLGDGFVLSGLFVITINAKRHPPYSAIEVAIAAPSIPSSGNPNLPKISTQSSSILSPALIIPEKTSGLV